MKPTLRKPIIISCAGRSGSTLFYRMIARHRDVAWLSSWNQMFPSQTWLALFSRFYRYRASARVRHAYLFPKPFSAYRFWQQYLPDIARHDRPLRADDVPVDAIEPLRSTIARLVSYQGKRRFVTKVTGWARMAYFDRVFPDARFIYLKRDPIAIMTSWVNAGWLNVTADIESDAWEWGDIPPAYRDIWKDLGGGPLLSAAIKTQLDLDDLQRNTALFSERCLEVNYEDLVRNPLATMRRTIDFCELPWDDTFQNAVGSTVVHNYTAKWKTQLQQSDAERIRLFFARAQAVAAST